MQAKCEASSATRGKLVLGLLHIGPIELAVPTAHLCEAVDRPARLSPLLTASPHVVGAIDVRGELVPVVDLRHALGLPVREQGQTGGRIVIISHEGHLFGMVVDALGGVVTLPVEHSREVEVLNPAAPRLMDRLIAQDGGARVVNVLRLEGVTQLIDMPLTRRACRTADRAVAMSGTAQQWRPYVLFECSGVRLAIDADVVETVIDIDHNKGPLSRSEGCIGLLHTDQRRMAVVDALAILGLGDTEPGRNRQVLVLKSQGHVVGVLISQVTQIARLNEGTRRAVPAMAFERPGFFEGMMPLEGQGDFLCISASAFLATTEVSAMASIHGRPMRDPGKPASAQAAGSTASQGAASARRADVYLTFRIGLEFGAPLRQVREILPMPQRMTPIRRDGDPRIGLFTHRDQIVPIVDMGMLLGAGAIECVGQTRLLLIDTESGVIALMVERVHAIETVQWVHEPIGQSQWRNADELQAALNARGLLTLSDEDARGSSQRAAAALDLPRIARAIAASYTRAAASEPGQAPVILQATAGTSAQSAPCVPTPVHDAAVA